MSVVNWVVCVTEACQAAKCVEAACGAVECVLACGVNAAAECGLVVAACVVVSAAMYGAASVVTWG